MNENANDITAAGGCSSALCDVSNAADVALSKTFWDNTGKGDSSTYPNFRVDECFDGDATAFSNDFILCATGDGTTCECLGLVKRAASNSDSSYTTKYSSGSLTCDLATFGSDPAVSAQKNCYCNRTARCG